jgi:hypothetical protein
MKRFYNNEREDEGSEDEGADEDIHEIHMGEQFMDAMHLDLAHYQINQQVLELAVRVCSSEWFWSFRSPAYKCRRLDRVYRRMIATLQD